jgi:hypothetical protein
MRSPDNTPERVKTPDLPPRGMAAEAMQTRQRAQRGRHRLVIEQMPDASHPKTPTWARPHILIILGEDEAIGIAQG